MRYVDKLIDFVSHVLYLVDKYVISLDLAFQIGKRKFFKSREPLRTHYAVARDAVINYFLLEYGLRNVVGVSPSRKRLVRFLLWLFSDRYFSSAELIEDVKRRFGREFRNVSWNDVVSAVEAIDDTIEKISVLRSYPKEFVDELCNVVGSAEFVDSLLAAMNQEVKWIRVNTLVADPDKVVKSLEAKGYVLEEDRDFPFLFKVVKFGDVPLHMLEEVEEGKVIIQDKASVVAVSALEPEPGDVILDACAAPGGKTSLIMQLTENRATVIAMDLSKGRLRNMMKLLKRYGVDTSRVHVVHGDAVHPPAKKVDKVLVDAPCTSSGAVRQDPAIKLHLRNLENLKRRFFKMQSSILYGVVSRVKAHVYVYVTCSLLPQEGESVVDYVCDRLPVEAVDPGTIGSPAYTGFEWGSKGRRLFTNVHDTNSFYIAKLVR